MYSSRHHFTLLVLAIFTLISCNNDSKSDTEPSNQQEMVEGDPVIQGISTLVQRSPDSHELYQKRGELLYDRERYAEAEQDLVKAIEIKDDIPQYYHLLADIQLDGARSREAIKTMERVIKLFPNRIPSYLKLAEFNLILKQYDKSIANINEIIRIDPQSADGYFMLGMNFREMGDESKALNSLQRAVEIDADMVDAWILLGNMYEKKNDPIAERYYKNAIESNPESIESMHSLADYMQNQERIDEAISLYDRILNINPKYDDAHLNAGILSLSIDSLDKALMHFTILSNTNPTNDRAREYKELALEMINEKQ